LTQSKEEVNLKINA